MKVKVLLFARYAALAGSAELEVDIAPPGTLGEVWRLVGERCPALASLPETPLIACDRTYARPDRRLRGGEEVAFFPPVSGG